MYLNCETVEDPLRKIASTAQGSMAPLTTSPPKPSSHGRLYWRCGRAATKSTGETLRFGNDRPRPPANGWPIRSDPVGCHLLINVPSATTRRLGVPGAGS